MAKTHLFCDSYHAFILRQSLRFSANQYFCGGCAQPVTTGQMWGRIRLVWMLTHLPKRPPNKLTPKIEKMSQKIMHTRNTLPMDGIAFINASTTTRMPWKRLNARNGRSALIVRKTRKTEREDEVVTVRGLVRAFE